MANNITVNIDNGYLDKMTEKGMMAGLKRAAAYLRGIARRKIRYTVYSHSKPGNPPHQHGKGKLAFKNTIVYDTDRKKLSAYIGPVKRGFYGNYSVPKVLEFGGMSNVTTAPWWYTTESVPASMNNRAEIATWLLSKGVGPLFMGTSANAVIHESSGKSYKFINQKRKTDPNAKAFTFLFTRNIRKFGQKPQRVYYYYFPIQTIKQAYKAADNIIKYYGYPRIGPFKIAPRPYMRPTVEQNLTQVLKKFNNVI